MRHEQSSIWSRVRGRPVWILELYIKIQTVAEALLDEQGQDLVEYGLLLVLIALAASASISGVATAIANVVTRVGTKLGTYTS